MALKKIPISENASTWFSLLFVLLISFFTYVWRFHQPPAVFWDEPYHIASAQKYLNRVYFMEPHPPFAKLLIALGEKIVHGNEKNDQFINTDYAKGFENFNFTGYRLFPTLLAWLTAPLLFGIFFVLLRNGAMATMLSFLYIFDNAQIVHSRGAMLDSTLTFLCMAMILVFLVLCARKTEEEKLIHLLRKPVHRHGLSTNSFVGFSLLFGILFGLVMTTKLVGLVMILLVPALLLRLWPDVRRMVTFFAIASTGFAIAYCAVWQIHFSLGATINPQLPEQSGPTGKGYYQASPEYKKILDSRQTSNPLAFTIMLRDSIKFVSHYNRGVPRLDLCKQDENGSPFFFWPLGARSINYRWEQAGEGMYRYLYLQVNPVVWLSALLGVLLSLALVAGPLLFPMKEPVRLRFELFTFLALYLGYMAAIARLQRVMYLYHYFLPLLFSFILLAVLAANINHFGNKRLTEGVKVVALTVLGLLIFGAFQFFRPLTYYEPITDKPFMRRALFPLWELHCVNCPKVSMLTIPTKQPE